MHDVNQRLAMVRGRLKVLRRWRESRVLAQLSALCLVMTVGLAGLIGRLGGRAVSGVEGLYGAAMLLEDAGGYVLVGVVAFAAGAALTVLCLRNKERGRTK